MQTVTGKFARTAKASLSIAVLALLVGLAAPSGASADEADAKKLLKAMSDYLAAQKTMSFQYDTNLEIVTTDQQKLAIRTPFVLHFSPLVCNTSTTIWRQRSCLHVPPV